MDVEAGANISAVGVVSQQADGTNPDDLIRLEQAREEFARAVIDGITTVPTPIIYDSRNVAGVVNSSVGKYDITLTNPVQNIETASVLVSVQSLIGVSSIGYQWQSPSVLRVILASQPLTGGAWTELDWKFSFTVKDGGP